MSISNKLKIGSLNINGLLGQSKRFALKDICRSSGVDVLFLQETHVCSINFAKNMETHLGGKAF